MLSLSCPEHLPKGRSAYKPTTKYQQLTTKSLVLAARCTTICAPMGAHCSALTYFITHTTRIPHAQLLLYPNPLMFCCARQIPFMPKRCYKKK